MIYLQKFSTLKNYNQHLCNFKLFSSRFFNCMTKGVSDLYTSAGNNRKGSDGHKRKEDEQGRKLLIRPGERRNNMNV